MNTPNHHDLPPARPPAASATLVVVREVSGAIEVLLLRRAERGDHNSGAWVFPGGKVDAADRQLHAYCEALDDTEASSRLGLSQGGLDYYIAAIRESFEEAGLLFARSSALQDDFHALVASWRARVQRSEHSLESLCRDAGLRLTTNELIYLSHWLTPVGYPKRFDTRFFLTTMPANQTAAADGAEMVEHLWIRPSEALANAATLKFIGPTRHTLATLARFDSVPALLQWAREPREIGVTLPRVAIGSEGRRPLLPHEPAWAEIGRIDPQGLGTASSELVPGRAVRLSSRVIRVTANNGSMMTGPGTNAYLIGGGAQNEWAVLDPGPLEAEHVDAILAAAPGAIRWILVTHTHKDHSPATRLLKEKTGAIVYGQLPTHPEWQDTSFAPDHLLQGGERIALPGESTLRVIHTPGHASNHLCYLLEAEKTLFTGDHIMQASTVVINPPDGNMAAYIASLRALLVEDIEWLAPGHGFLMAQPRRVVEWIIQHRHKREAKVIAAMQALGPATMETLLPKVYDDVHERLHGPALRSLYAHLLKLHEDGIAADQHGEWQLLIHN